MGGICRDSPDLKRVFVTAGVVVLAMVAIAGVTTTGAGVDIEPPAGHVVAEPWCDPSSRRQGQPVQG
jgi:hypothetical protein